MLNGQKVVALIPARAGSQRLPDKNILKLAGKPLIAWSVEAAVKSEYIDDVIVSTDCDIISNVAIKHGAKTPFLRPKELSHNTASTDDVLLHAINELSLLDNDIIVLLQPTSPLRNSSDIDQAIILLSQNGVQGSVTLCECEHSPLWTNTVPDDLNLGGFLSKEYSTTRSQDLPTFYRLNGAVYAYRVAYLKEHKGRVYTSTIKASIMPQERSIDIDVQLDFDIADMLVKNSSEPN
jgi:CMP-N-acetylneuraminic acid synthetase